MSFGVDVRHDGHTNSLHRPGEGVLSPVAVMVSNTPALCGGRWALLSFAPATSPARLAILQRDAESTCEVRVQAPEPAGQG